MVKNKLFCDKTTFFEYNVYWLLIKRLYSNIALQNLLTNERKRYHHIIFKVNLINKNNYFDSKNVKLNNIMPCYIL